MPPNLGSENDQQQGNNNPFAPIFGGNPQRGTSTALSTCLSASSTVTPSSSDEGLTWERRRIIHDGHAAYSDLVAISDDQFACVFGTGEKTSRRDLAVARFDLDWVMGSNR